MKIANALEWHDGVFRKMEIESGEAVSVRMLLCLYDGGGARNRTAIEFYEVGDLVSSIDGRELLDNKSAGNISNGYIKKIGRSNRYRFHLYLSDGYISLTFRYLKVDYLRH